MKNSKFDYIFAFSGVGKRSIKDAVINNDYCAITLQVLSKLIQDKGKLTIILPMQFCINEGKDLSLRTEIEKDFSIISLKELPENLQKQSMISLTIQKTPPTPKRVLIEKLEFENEKRAHFVSSNKILISQETLRETHDWLPAYYLQYPNETFKRIRLSDACFIKIGLTYSKTSKDSIAVGLLNISDINSDYIDLNKLGRSGIDKNINADLFLQMNDVILARLGTGNFKTGIIKEYVPNCIPSQNIIILRTMNPLLNPDYLNIFLQSPKGKKILKDAESGQVIKRLNLRDVANIEIPLPSLEAQQGIVDKFNKAKENYQTTINQAEQQWEKVQENIYQAL